MNARKSITRKRNAKVGCGQAGAIRRVPSQALLALLLSAVACNTAPDAATESAALSKEATEVPFELTFGRAGVHYTWVDGEGRFHTTEDASEIDESARTHVRVIVEGQPTGTETSVFVANLTGVSEKQPVPLTAMPRDAWEAFGLKHRQAVVQPLENAAKEKAPALPADVDAILYGAEWCGACRKAEAYLKKRGLDVMKKDVETDPSASAEMRAKLQSIGRRGSSIPVLDVHGTVLVGFSPKAIEAALSQAKQP